MLRSLRAPLIVVALLLLVAPVAPAQQQEMDTEPQAEFGEEVQVSEVLLDVVVTNRDGDVVVGLGPDDFVVRENGEPVEIQSVSFYSSSVPQESVDAMREKGVKVDRDPEDRYFILFFDDQRRYQSDVRVNLMQRQMQAGRDARDWVEEDLAPADWVAVVGFDYSLQIYTDFTRDRQRLLDAIDRAAAGREGMGNWPSRQKEEGPSLLDDLPQGKFLVKATPRIYDALELVAEATGDIVGRKNLVYVGFGFGELNTFGQYRRDQRYYPDMMHALNDNNVAVYTLDVTPSGVEHPLEAALSELATDTGGRFFPTFTSFRIPLEEVSEETSGYYLLSYRSRHEAGESGFQKVKVDTENPEFRVRTRRGYQYGDDGGS